ncbi:ribonuclease Z, partial [mine drainage metagenome]
EDDKVHFIKDRCRKLGIKGTMFSQLERGETLTINKKRIKLKDVTNVEIGRKVVYATDSRPTSATIRAASDADILIHEATYADELKGFAKERKHSTAMEAAEIAKSAKARRLLLFHPSARYKDTGVLVKEARKVFKNTDMAYDGMKIHI